MIGFGKVLDAQGLGGIMNTSSTLAHHLPIDQIAADATAFIKPNHPAFPSLFCSPTAIDPPEVAKFILVRKAHAGTEILHCYWTSVPW